MTQCEYFQKCKNNNKCLRCTGYSLLGLPRQKNMEISKKSLVINQKTDKPWEKLEKNVANIINEKSRRSRASGALSFEKGDVLDDILFIECKSRSGTEIKKGADKSLSISKKWIEKAQKEAAETQKPLLLPFQFAEDANDSNKIYAIMNIHDVVDLITMVKNLRSQITEKEQIIQNFKKGEK